MPVPLHLAFTRDEAGVIARCTSPRAVQRWLNRLPYNVEAAGETLRSFRGVVREGTAHCLEAALAAAVILEQHGYPPLVLSFESVDHLDHVIFVYREEGRWGSVARSRDPGLHGRKPVFRSARALAASYRDPYVDFSGAITGFAVVNVAREMGRYDWRLSTRNVWKVEQMLIDYPHRPLPTPPGRVSRLRAWYREYRARYGRKPIEYAGRERWSELPPDCPRRDVPFPAPR